MKYIKTFEGDFSNDVYYEIYDYIKSDDVDSLKSLEFDPNYFRGDLLKKCIIGNAINCLKYLISIGGDIYANRCMNLLAACDSGEIEIIKYLLSIMNRDKIHDCLVEHARLFPRTYGSILSDKDFLVKWVTYSGLTNEKKGKVINFLESEY
jgi:hypothetical protein